MLKLTSTIFEHHDLRLVVLAGLVCFLAAYTAFSMVSLPYAQRSRYPWVVAAAVVTGCGAWAAHAIALLAFQPGVALTYDVPLAVLSGIVVVAGAGAGFYIARSTESMALGGAVIGFAIGAMQIVGMASLILQAQVEWDTVYLQAAVVVGASFGAAALSRARITPDLPGRIAGATLLTASVMATYFVAMPALSIMPDPNLVIPEDTIAVVWFAIALTAVIFLIIGLGVVATLVDQHIQEVEAAKRELEAALVLAGAANKSKNKFLSTMSHELRSPLNVIIGFSELLKKGSFGPREEQYREYIDSILNSGVHLLRLVNDILDISKFDAGHLELNEEIVNPGECVAACMRLVVPEAEKAGVRMTVALDPDLPMLRGDAQRLRQILINLLSNAIRFTPKGGEVRVSAFRQGDAVALSVSDTGIGMAANEIPKALERFGQLDAELSRKYDGAGLGLPLAQHLVELHGGSLRIESEPGIGTNVTVLFPATRSVKGYAQLTQAA